MPAIVPSAASPVQPVTAGGVQAAVAPAAAPLAAAMPQGEALVIESGDGFAVVAFDRRLLGLDGPLQAPPGSRLWLRLPQGSPGIGGSGPGTVSTQQAGRTVEVPVTVRLAARHAGAVPVRITDIASGADVEALLVALPESGYGVRRDAVREPASRALLIAVVVDDGAPDTVRLRTAAGGFLLPRGEAAPSAGSQVALLPVQTVERRDTGRTAAVEARPEPHGDVEAAAPGGDAAALPTAPARNQPHQPVGLPLPPGLSGPAADGIAIAPEDGGYRPDRVGRLLIAIELSRLGPMQIDLRRNGEACDIVVRSQLPLDLHIRGEIGEAVRAATGGRIPLAFVTGLAAMPTESAT